MDNLKGENKEEEEEKKRSPEHKHSLCKNASLEAVWMVNGSIFPESIYLKWETVCFSELKPEPCEGSLKGTDQNPFRREVEAVQKVPAGIFLFLYFGSLQIRPRPQVHGRLLQVHLTAISFQMISRTFVVMVLKTPIVSNVRINIS